MTVLRMKTIASAITGFLLLSVSLSQAQDIHISADSMEQKGNIHILRGSVKIVQDDTTIRARSAIYDEATGDTYAEGDVYYEDAHATIRAKSAQLNLRDDTGMLYDGEVFFKQGGYRITGKEIYKTGKDRYVFKHASATTCMGSSPAWCFTSRDADVLVGERLKAKHTTFRVKGLPLFYTPYFWAPIITERRTGFLIPTLGYQDTTGFFYRQPFFWAVSENRDATLFLDLYSKGSFGQGVEYRYMERPGISGNINVYHMRDESVDRNYYETRLRHWHPGRHFSGFLDINTVNYIDFYRRYEPYIETSATRYLESRAEVSAHAGNSRAYVLGQHYQDLDVDADQNTVLHRLPEAGIFIAPLALGPVVVTGAGSIVDFQRKEGIYGRRFGANMKAAYTIGRGPTLTQSVEARRALYRLHGTDTGEDTYGNNAVDYTATLQANISRAFWSVNHEFVPSIAYASITRTGDDLPGSVFFDSTEYIVETSLAHLTLMNRLRNGKGQFLTLQATQQYDFIKEREGGRPFLPLVLNMAITRPLSLSLGLTYDTYERHSTAMNSRATFNLPRTTVSVGHAYQRAPEIITYYAEASLKVTRSISLGGRVRYDRDDSGPKELALDASYFKQCWGLSIEYAERQVVLDGKEQKERWIFFKIRLLGVGSFGFSAISDKTTG